MKKYTKLSMAAVMAASALIPTAAFAADSDVPTKAPKGFYNIAKDAAVPYYTIAAFKGLTKAEKVAILDGADWYLVASGNVFPIAALDASDDEFLAAKIDEEKFEADNKLTLTGEGGIIFEDPIPTELTVESVSAINPTTVKVTFNKEAEALAKADVTVTNKDNNKVLVKAVTLAEDKKTATVEFYDALTAGDYKVAVKDAGEASFKYEVGVATSIVAETTQTFAKNATGKKVAYKVLDENGLDITSTVTDVEVQATSIVNLDGTVVTTTEGSAFAYVVVTKEDGSELKSDRITVKIEADKVAEIADYTVDTEATQGDFNFKAIDYKQNTKVPVKGSAVSLHVQTKNQFGETKPSTTAKFESLDLDVAVVDASTGKITPVKEGKFAVKITDGTVSKTVELEVVAEAKATTIELDKTEVAVSNKANTPVKVKATVKNQFGTAMTGQTITAAATTNAGKDLVNVTVSNGEVSVSPKAGVKSGTATIEVKVSEEVKSTFTVTVTEASAVDSYKLVGFTSKLDKNVTNAAETPQSATLSVVPLDENGVEAGTAVPATYSITDKDKTVVSTSSSINAASLDAGAYKLEVKVGNVTVATETFEVVDTTPQPELEFTSTTVTDTLTVDGNVFEEVSAKLKATLADKEYTVGGTNNLQIDKISYTTTNSAIVASATDATDINFVKDGSVDLLVGKVTITVDSKEYTINLNNFKLTVTSEEDAVTAGTLYLSADAIASTNPFLTTLVLTNNVQAPTTAAAIQSALEAKLATMQDENYDATDRDISGITTATAADVKFNGENIKISADGKRVEITGPVMSPKAFIVAKGGKNLVTTFNITLYKAGAVANVTGSIEDADKLAVIEISADGSATVVPAQ